MITIMPIEFNDEVQARQAFYNRVNAAGAQGSGFEQRLINSGFVKNGSQAKFLMVGLVVAFLGISGFLFSTLGDPKRPNLTKEDDVKISNMIDQLKKANEN
jgi:hypothetical protein